MSTLHWVDVETAPFRVLPDGEIETDFTGLFPGLDPAMIDALEDLINRVDEDTCQAAGCLVGGIAGNGPVPVGLVLHEDDEHPSGGGVRWHWTTLVRKVGSDRVLLVCEECSPSNVYEVQS